MKDRVAKTRPYKHHANPKRGGPAMMLTCERGRESKSHREALDILRHYYQNNKKHKTIATTSPVVKSKKLLHDSFNSARLSLDDEIELLKKGVAADDVLRDNSTKSDHGKCAPFQEYRVDCGGIVFIMCTLHSQHSTLNHNNDDELNNMSKGATTDEKSTMDEENKNETVLNTKKRKVPTSTDWDPIHVLNQVINDIHNTATPSSRFIIRMIPIQLTCWASLTEVKETAEQLLRQFLIPNAIQRFTGHYRPSSKNPDKYQPITFKIELKKRNCNHLKRDEMIKLVADLVQNLADQALTMIETRASQNADISKEIQKQHISKTPSLFSVNLKNAEYTIIIEVVNTLVGMSVVHNAHRYRNFNIMELKQQKEEK